MMILNLDKNLPSEFLVGSSTHIHTASQSSDHLAQLPVKSKFWHVNVTSKKSQQEIKKENSMKKAIRSVFDRQ